VSWLFLDLKSPVLFRDGRSYDSTTIGRSTAHPMPQAVLGALRAHVGRALGFDWNFGRAPSRITDLLGTPDRPGSLRIAGPYYARTIEDGLALQPLFARPADLVAFPHLDRRRMGLRMEHPLRPGSVPATSVSAPAGMTKPLLPVLHVPAESKKKPLDKDDLPAYLTPNETLYWLRQASATPKPRGENVPEVPGPCRDLRVNVDIGKALTAEDQMLYTTERLAMPVEPGKHGSFVERTYGYALRVEADSDVEPLVEGIWRIGGKGGAVVARVVPLDSELDAWRGQVLADLADRPRFRWVLTTPGLFANGFRPDFVQPDGTAVFPGTTARVRLVAAVVDRPIPYSGWDLQHPGRESGRGRATGAPRPTRLFVPPGSVYFFEANTPADARAVVEACWGRSLFAPRGAMDRAAAIDVACGLCTGLFGPWDTYGDA
jgi:CRISPR-associated protein Cmr3